MNDSASLIVIGNEILSGKVEDTNSPWLLKELRRAGIVVQRLQVIPDSLAVISSTVARAAVKNAHVLTTGGVGPTLDDITYEAVAKAFGREVIENPQLAQIIHDHLGDKTNDNHLKMARIPEGAELLWGEDLKWPVVRLANVTVLPGEPTYLRQKFLAIRGGFRGVPFQLRRIYVQREEGEVAPVLDSLQARYPEVAIGSYPVFGRSDWKVFLTLEHRDEATVDEALEALLLELDAEDVVRVDQGPASP